MVTLKDVAKKAGVAVSTASYALNNNPKISETTRNMVLTAANELDYRPNGTARNLKKQKTETIGLFLNDLAGPYYSEIIRGVQKVVSDNEYDLVVCSASGGTDSTAYKFLQERRVDGAVILAPKITDKEIYQVARTQLPVVVLDRKLESDYIKYVLIDNVNGSYQAVTHLINRGYKNIGFLSGPEESYDNKERYEGFSRALNDNNFLFDENLLFKGDFTEEEGYKVISKFLKNDISIDALFAANDEMAIGAIQAIKENNYQIPNDIAVVGFDDIRLSSYINPPLTTVRHPKYEMGTFATHMIFQILQGAATESIVLPTQLINRESS